jgi:hypothetical protein
MDGCMLPAERAAVVFAVVSRQLARMQQSDMAHYISILATYKGIFEMWWVHIRVYFQYGSYYTREHSGTRISS